MGQVLPGSARTTKAVHRAIQKWRMRQATADARTGSKKVRPTVLTSQGEAIIVEVRRHTLLPPDDCLYTLQPTILRSHLITAAPLLGTACRLCRHPLEVGGEPARPSGLVPVPEVGSRRGIRRPVGACWP
jgi:hypothetical protein